MKVCNILYAVRSSRRLSAATNIATKQLEKYALYNPVPINLSDFVKFGDGSTQASCRNSFLFLRKELPVRLANIMKEINLLPELLVSMPSVQIVESWYEQSFEEILRFEKASADDGDILDKFTEALITVRARHADVVQTMAHGMVELTEECGASQPTDAISNQVQYFLDRFYMSRISIRMLINQHIMLFGKDLERERTGPYQRHIGSIDPYCNIINVAEDAYANARFLCEQYYLISPEPEFIPVNPFEKCEHILITYVPSHLYHMLFELYKNAMRAVVEYHSEASDLPKISTMICKGKEDLTIKIGDQGGGIDKGHIDLLFNYMYSTAPRPPSPDSASTTPLAGYGYGLPLSRLYAKYFGGDLNLSSVDGYGTDAMIYLKVKPSESSELLPVYNHTSLQRYGSNNPVADWSDCTQTGGLQGAVHQVQPHRYYSTKKQNSRRAQTENDSGSHCVKGHPMNKEGSSSQEIQNSKKRTNVGNLNSESSRVSEV